MIDAFLIHGIGKRGSSAKSFTDITQGIFKHLPNNTDVNIRSIDYSALLDKRETEILEWVKSMSGPFDLLAKYEREFIAYYICDVLAYAYPKRKLRKGDFMYDLQELLAREMSTARKGAKTMIIGHSLGSIVGYGATWDVHTDCLVTMGSPFSWFSIRYADGGEMNPDLPEFHNFWSSRDRVSTIVSKNPKFRCVHDYKVETWNPFMITRLARHGVYFTSSFVHKSIANIMKKLEAK